MKTNLSIVVSSCDAFKDCWEPFIYSIKRYWADCHYHIYILSNFDEIDTPHGISFIKVGEDKMFASNLKVVLKRIDSDYIIYLQDDYWLNKKVDNNRITSHINYCVNNQIDYMRLTFPFQSGKNVNGIYRQHVLSQRYAICLQAAIWNRNTLSSLLRDGDSGWDFEYKIQKYAIQSHIRVKALGIKREFADGGFNYVRGTGVRKGRWTIEGYKFLVDHGFNSILKEREREGWFFGNIVDKQGPFRPLFLVIAKIMMEFKWNF